MLTVFHSIYVSLHVYIYVHRYIDRYFKIKIVTDLVHCSTFYSLAEYVKSMILLVNFNMNIKRKHLRPFLSG